MGIVEIQIIWRCTIDSASDGFGGGCSSELQLHGTHCRGGDCQEKHIRLQAARPDDQSLGASEMGKGEAAEGVALFQRRGWEEDRSQKLTRGEDILVVAGDEIHHGHLAGCAFAGPERADALERGSEGNHRSGR